MNIIDTHAHLDMPEFDLDREDVIRRAHENGVHRIITIGINPESNLRAIALAEKYSMVYAGIGIHPQDSTGIQESDCLKLIEQAKHPRVVAIGELGLDFHREKSAPETQIQVLQWQLAAVKEIHKPIVIHCRNAHQSFLPLITAWIKSIRLTGGTSPGVLHCFNLDISTARPYLEMGFYLSIGAYIGYPSSSALRETVKSMPLERIMVETDCPFLPPQKMRGKRNEPAFSVHTVDVLAQIKNVSPEEMAAATTANASRLFKID